MKPVDFLMANLLRVQSEQFRAMMMAAYDPPSFTPEQLARGETIEPVSNVVKWDGRVK